MSEGRRRIEKQKREEVVIRTKFCLEAGMRQSVPLKT